MQKVAKASEQLAKQHDKLKSRLMAQGVTEKDAEAITHSQQEMKLRRNRLRVQRTHMQKEMLLHRVGEMAMLGMIGSQNKFAAALSKGGITAQMMGQQMSMFGGVTGKVGGVLEKAGGYFALAGLAVEGASAIAEAFGVDMEKLEENVKGFSRSLLSRIGLMKSEEALEREKDEMELLALNKRLNSDRKADGILANMASRSEKLNEQYEKNQKTMAQVKAAAEQYAGRLRKAGMTDAAVEETKEKFIRAYANVLPSIAPKLKSIPVEKTSQAMAEWNTQAMESAEYLHRMTGIPIDQAFEKIKTASEHLAESFEAKYSQTYIDIEKEERARVILEDLQKKQLKMMNLRVPGEHASLQANQKYTQALQVAASAVAMKAQEIFKAEGLKFEPDKLKEIFGDLKTLAPHYDFRHSRFDIKQAFAEGFDPDRIAVAFADDIGRLGERRLQSGLSPLYSVR
jgi:hypothetical protein